MGRLAALAAALLLAGGPVVPGRADEEVSAPSGSFAVRGCRVITVCGEEIPEGVVVVRKGRIDAVGAVGKLPVPPGLPVVEGAGRVLTPGFVHGASRLGLRSGGPGGSGTVSPDAKVDDDLVPWLPANRWAAAAGFTTLGLLPGPGLVGGRGLAVRSAAPAVDGMVLRQDALLRCDAEPGGRFRTTLSSMLSQARRDLDQQAKWTKDHADWEEKKKKAEDEKKKPPTEPKEPKLDPKREAYRKVLQGETALYCIAPDSAAVHAVALSLADETARGPALRLYVQVGGEAYRSAAELADLGAVCVVRAGLDNYAGLRDIVAPSVLYRNAGCRVILLPERDDRDGLRSFAFSLVRIVRAGFPADAAWEACTLGPARMLGLGEETGAIGKGRRADLILWDGDPFAATTRIERVWVGGDAVEGTP